MTGKSNSSTKSGAAKFVLGQAPLVFILAMSACAGNDTAKKESDPGITPIRWQTAATWEFHITDAEQRDLGTIVLRLSPDVVEEDSCAKTGWRKAIVMEDNLDFDFSADKQPAFNISANWITIDLTATVCNVNHVLIGELVEDGAAGHFNYSHPLGGYSVGTFKATPIVD